MSVSHSRGASNRISNGVDIVEIKKAKSFYRNHQDRLHSFFSKNELMYIRKGKKPEERVAALLAAKEAVFKALGCPLKDFFGFENIRIISRTRNRLSYTFKHKFAEKGFRKNLSLSLMKTRKYVIVRCVGTT